MRYKDLPEQCKTCENLRTMHVCLPTELSDMNCKVKWDRSLRDAKDRDCPDRRAKV